mgnify:CR=1 FL=1
MRKKRDTAPVEQLELDFESVVVTPDVPSSSASNVVRVQFGTPKTPSLTGTPKDRALVERILQSAQRLKW